MRRAVRLARSRGGGRVRLPHHRRHALLDESAYYAFSLAQIERDIEGPTGELDQMCRELVARAADDERIPGALRIPERFWTMIAASWKRGDPSLYGRFDLSYDGKGPAKLLEYNADTPTSLFETGVCSGCGSSRPPSA